MAYLNKTQLASLGLRHLGQNVKISDKASLHDPESISIGDNSRVDDFCVLSGHITMNRNVHLAVFTNLAGGKLGITMDDFSGTAYGVHIFTQSDDYSGKAMTNATVPAQFTNTSHAAVNIGRHVIIGTGAIVLPGVTVAEGCSIGAMSLVSKSTEPWGIYMGNPARKFFSRERDLLKLEGQYLAGDVSNLEE
jgi:acetyltransferase-like isoleucine patch superfamily enzyme